MKTFLRQRGLTLWRKDHPTAVVVRKLAYEKNRSYSTYSVLYLRRHHPRSQPTRSSALSTKQTIF